MNRNLQLIQKNRDDILSVAELLYGDGAWEISKALTQQEKRERTQARVGLASNVVGITAGAAGLGAAMRDDRLKGTKIFDAADKAQKTIKATRLGGKYYTLVKKPKVAAGLAGGAVALQAANLGGDFVANRVLSRSAKKGTVQKGMFRNIKTTVSNAERVSANADKISEDVRNISGKLNKLTNKKTAAAAVGGTAVTLGGAQYAGSYYGTKHGTRAGQKPKTPKPVVLAKSATPEIEWRGEISKMDSDKRQVFGWASIVEVNGEPVVDLQGDYLTIEEIEKAAYDYVKKSRVGGNQHQKGVHVSDMIESFLVTEDKKQQMGLPADTPTGWWVGFQVNDDATWAQVKNGERREFSIHGSGIRKDVEV